MDGLLHFKEKKMKRLFIDMDGTLARFHEQNNYLERMYENNFFVMLNAYENFLKAICSIHNYHDKDIEVHILSSVSDVEYERMVADKVLWLCGNGLKFDFDRLHFPLIGTSKTSHIKGAIKETDILIDDYNHNLSEWRMAGGTSIKFVNDINDKGINGPLWDGLRVRYDWSSERIEDELLRIVSSLQSA